MSKIIFISFANYKNRKSLECLNKDVSEFGFYKTLFLTERDLPAEFVHKMKVGLYHRGFGYWRWKPYIINRELKKMNDDDILIYSDAGNKWNIKGLNKYEKYLSFLLEKNYSFLVFSQPFLEKDWTKGDIFKVLNLEKNKEIAMSLQLWAGCFFIRKTKESVKVIEIWNHLVNDVEDLVTDKSSIYSNFLGFEENRHDQSIFSLLVKQSNYRLLDWSEVQTLDRIWDVIENNPILAKRVYASRQKNNLQFFVRKISSLLIGCYLLLFKKFHFKNKISW